MSLELKPIAHIHTDFPEKFGLPRQSGVVPELLGYVVFEPEFRDPAFLKGIGEFSHLWLIWHFEDTSRDTLSATVRPPRLGGNETRGVFATRSPFRPNPLGLSCVRLEKVELNTPSGPVLTVSGIDQRDNTPIFDIKPYIAYTDSHPEALEGFAGIHKNDRLKVIFPEALLEKLPEEKRSAAAAILSEDPRPHYICNASREYGLTYAGFNIRFSVDNTCLTVISTDKLKPD